VPVLGLQLYEIPQLFPPGGLFPGAFRIIEWAAALIYKSRNRGMSEAPIDA
jgi:hypothetical protein